MHLQKGECCGVVNTEWISFEEEVPKDEPRCVLVRYEDGRTELIPADEINNGVESHRRGYIDWWEYFGATEWTDRLEYEDYK